MTPINEYIGSCCGSKRQRLNAFMCFVRAYRWQLSFRNERKQGAVTGLSKKIINKNSGSCVCNELIIRPEACYLI